MIGSKRYPKYYFVARDQDYLQQVGNIQLVRKTVEQRLTGTIKNCSLGRKKTLNYLPPLHRNRIVCCMIQMAIIYASSYPKDKESRTSSLGPRYLLFI